MSGRHVSQRRHRVFRLVLLYEANHRVRNYDQRNDEGVNRHPRSTLQEPSERRNSNRDQKQVHQRVGKLGQKALPTRLLFLGHQRVRAILGEPALDLLNGKAHVHVHIEVAGHLLPWQRRKVFPRSVGAWGISGSHPLVTPVCSLFLSHQNPPSAPPPLGRALVDYTGAPLRRPRLSVGRSPPSAAPRAAIAYLP